MGGLGNQIFQIFATIAYSIKSNNSFRFLSVETLGGGGACTLRYTYWNNFFSNLKPFLSKILPQMETIRENGFRYNDIPISNLSNKNILLHGYFQSYKYFDENYKTICKIIKLDEMKEKIFIKYNLNQDYLNNTISMHFRLGDYKKVSDFHPIMEYEYYKKSLSHIKNITDGNHDLNVLFFCEDEDIETVMKTIDKLQNDFPNYTFERKYSHLEDWEQMLLMSLCFHNIIANSSFSWWSAYFNSNVDKIVCYPSVWFGEKANIDTSDLCPKQWKKIKV
jgi:hypothetical protein